jgi:hypothetical protein
MQHQNDTRQCSGRGDRGLRTWFYVPIGMEGLIITNDGYDLTSVLESVPYFYKLSSGIY